MPGRQAHGRPLLADPNKKRKGGRKNGGGNIGGGGNTGGAFTAGRSSGGAPRTRQGGRVDVMALAEQQIGESRAKGVRVRDLQIEREQGKRRRNDEDDEDEDEDDEEEAPKRRRPNDDKEGGDGSSDEMHSDSSGNEWREGVGSDDDDSEIDSDEAFGDSEDDEVFDAFTFRGSSSKQKKNKNSKNSKPKDDNDFDGFDDDHDTSDEDVGDDGADLDDEAIDLAAALDIVSSDEDEVKTLSDKKDKPRKKTTSQFDNGNISASDISTSDSDNNDDNDDESDSDQSTNSSDFDSDEDDDEEDHEDGVNSKSDALQSIASAYAAGGSDDSDSDGEGDVSHAANPYQFNAILGSKDSSLKKSIKAAVSESSGKRLDVPLLPMQQNRQLRVAAAEKAHETLDRWTDTVKHNRRAEHLTFEVAGSLTTSGLDTTSLMPISQSSAHTELEKTILSIMEESGLGAKAQADDRAEQKKLERAQAEAQLSPDALKAIIGQKRRARELQSRELARAKRIKKIKSKAYRRVHRRERQRAEDALDDSDAEHDSDEDKDSEAEREAAHRRRAMERMGSRHRDSRWAKRAKNTNRAAWDDEFRSGLVDMARQDEELRMRVDGAGVGGGKPGNAGGSDESDSESFEDSDDQAFKLRIKEELASSDGAGKEGEPKGLMAIAFMKKAEQARKKANDDAVAEILRDLDRGDDSDEDAAQFEEDIGDDEDGDKAVGRRTYGPTANVDKSDGANRPARQQTADALHKNAALFSTDTAASSSKPSNVKDVSSTLLTRKASAPGDAGLWTVVGTTGTSDKKKSKKTTSGNAGTTAGLTSDGRLMMSAVVDNVLAQNKAAEERTAAKNAARESAALKKSTAAAARKAAAEAAGESDTSSSGSDSEEDADDADHRTASRSKYFKFRAESNLLLSKALGEDDAEAEFAAEKAAQALEEAAAWDDQQAKASGRKDKDAAVMPGWGSWVGDGVSKRAVKRDQRAFAANGTKSGKGKTTEDKKALIRRDAKMDKVIISEKRNHKNDKYLASQLPHEYETRMQYERSLRLPVGPEWSTMFAFQDATKPRIIKKQGVVLPMAKPRI